MGAHHVVNHRNLREEVRGVAPDGINWILSPFSAGNVETYAEIMGVHGEVVAIDEPEGLDTLPLKSKSQTWHWELMFTRPLYAPEDDTQRRILDEVARLVDAGTLRTTMTDCLSPLDVHTLREAHRRVETGTSIGKLVIAAG
jgi:NADPH:quinone reductase-like Zn-dependent oxidoreductase